MQDKETFMDKEIKRVASFFKNREIIRRRRVACLVDMVKNSRGNNFYRSSLRSLYGKALGFNNRLLF